ncbi:MAG: PAS domain S-box protein [Candidatus Altiarchaeia archaeon]
MEEIRFNKKGVPESYAVVKERVEQKRVKLDDIIEFLPDAALVIDANNTVIKWNKAIEEMTGVPKSDILGKTDYSYALPFYGEKRPILINFLNMPEEELKKKYAYVERRGNTIFAETFIPLLNNYKGAYLWAKASALLDKDGTYLGAIETIRDVTERRKAVQALKESEELYRNLVESAGDAIVSLDTGGRFTFFSRMAEEVTGYKAAEVIGKGMDLVVSPGSLKLTSDSLNRRIKGESVNPYVIDILTKNKKTIPAEIFGRCISNGANVTGVVVVVRDITRRKNREEALNPAYSELAQELQNQGAISKISSMYTSIECFDETTNQVMELLGKLTNASKVYLFESFDNGERMKNTYGWVNTGVKSQIQELQNVRLAEMPSILRMLTDGAKIINSPDIRSLPKEFCDYLTALEVRSILILPITVRNRLYGAIGLSEDNACRVWKESEVSLIRVISEIMSNAFERRVAGEEIKKKADELQKRVTELEKFEKVLVDRELRMIELKRRILELEGKNGKPR